MTYDVNQHATAETRRAGALAATEAKRRKREEARDRASDELSRVADAALARLELLVETDDDAVAFRAVKDVLDRVLGRPGQAIQLTGYESGPIEIEHRGVRLEDVLRVAREAGIAPSEHAA